MRRLIGLLIAVSFLFILLPGESYCQAADSKLELEWDYFTPSAKSRDIDTVSLHILGKISEKNGRTVYRGITITRPHGNILPKNQTQTQDSSAVGIGPVYMVRNELWHSGKLTTAVDMSGGFIIYDKKFPAGANIIISCGV